MNNNSYPYRRLRSRRYTFISEGKRQIEKIVDFIPLGINNIVNIGFGDLLPDGSIDDKVNSNNGDIAKVLGTVIEILRDFTSQYPKVVIYFRGSTIERTQLYTRILKTYYSKFSKEFAILGVIGTINDNKTVTFNPDENQEYLAFLIKKIS